MKRTFKLILKLSLPLLYMLLVLRSHGQSTPLTIKQAIETALANNYSLKADSMNLESAGYKVALSKAAFLPQINYSSKTEYNLAIATQMLPGAIMGQPDKELVPAKFGTRYSWGNAVEITQPVFNKTNRYQSALAAINSDIAHTRHNMSREELVYKVAESFYSLQANAEMIRLTEKDCRNLEEIVRIAKAQYENGLLKRIDYESLQINAANKRSQLNQSQADYDEQLTWFKYLLGISPAAIISITPVMQHVTTDVVLNDEGLNQREDILLYTQLMNAKETELKSIHAEKKPVITSWFRFSYQAQFNGLSNAFNNDFRYKSSAMGISASISIFDGHRRKNRERIAQAQLQELKIQSAQQKQLASAEWISGTEKLNSDKKNFNIAGINLALAEKVFTTRKALYTEGVSSLIELLDAEKELSQSRNIYIRGQVNMQLSALNLHKAKGTLLNEFFKSL